MTKLRSSIVSVGADPEVFFESKGKPIPAIGLVGGTKKRPRLYGIGAVQEDNVMAEFNIPPATTPREFNSYVASMLQRVRGIAKSHGLGVRISPWAEFEAHQLRHPQALTMGCEPDYNAYIMDKNPSPSLYDLKNIRVAAGHVHVGISDIVTKSPEYRSTLVKVLDLYLGIPSVVIDPDTVRRNFYGKAGAYRPKPYGVEYRVLSNFWIDNPRLRRWVFNSVVDSVARVSFHTAAREKIFTLVQTAINEHDVKLAKQLIKEYRIQMP